MFGKSFKVLKENMLTDLTAQAPGEKPVFTQRQAETLALAMASVITSNNSTIGWQFDGAKIQFKEVE